MMGTWKRAASWTHHATEKVYDTRERIPHVRLSDEGAYDCVVTGDCNRVASIAASLDMLCIADRNGDGVVDFNDFLAFMNDYNAGDPRADLNGDGIVDFNDFLAFINLFNAGC